MKEDRANTEIQYRFSEARFYQYPFEHVDIKEKQPKPYTTEGVRFRL